MNKQILSLVGVSEEEYIDWCKETGRRHSLLKTKREFFERIREGKLVRDKDGKLINKDKRVRK